MSCCWPQEPMPVSWRYEYGLLVITSSAAYDLEEAKQSTAAGIADPRFQPGTAILFDSSASTAAIEPADIEERVAWLIQVSRRGVSRFAVVVGAETHRYGLARMLSTRLELAGVELGVFRSFEAARAWLSPRP